MNELFMEIFNKYHKDVYRLIYSYTLNIQDTEDILQRTFIKLHNNIDKFDCASEDVKRWLFKVAVNDSKNLLKSFWRKKKIDIEDYDNLLSYEKGNNSLKATLKHMNTKYRIPLYLYYYEGYSIKEIAGITKETESCIKSRLKRGKEKLRIEMEEV